jgi:glycerophosphoryl diester phosphodiesterase
MFDAALFVRPIAHRGLHSRVAGRIENSAAAFRAAIDRGYGIECDLQAAKDGVPMVFHDERLERLFAARGRVSAYTAAELARLQYRGRAARERSTRRRGGPEGMLTFAECLRLIAGRVPVLAEVKRNRSPPPHGFLERIAADAAAYAGPLALMSFDRGVLRALGGLAPLIARGWIAGRHQLAARWWAAPGAPRRERAVARLLAAAPRDIAFLAVEVAMVRAARAHLAAEGLALPLFTWTVRSERQRQAAARWADAPIFEGYVP